MLTPEAALSFNWPPPYTIRESNKARSIRLTICVQKGLVIVVPKRQKSTDLCDILAEKRPWIEKYTNIILQHLQLIEQQHCLPSTLTFPAFQIQMQVLYEKTASKRIYLKQVTNTVLLISGSIQNNHLVIKKLKLWLIEQAKQLLIPWLSNLSEKIGLAYTNVQIKSQKTTWGTCNRHKQITLNYKLLFLPKNLVEYVLLHELCHIQHLNHSRRFWNTLKKFDPNCFSHRQQLKMEHSYLPTCFLY